MKEDITILYRPATPKIILGLSILLCVFWYVGTNFNVYSFAVVGAIFELASIQMLVLLALLPIASFLILFKEKFSFKLLSLYSFLLSLIAILLMVLKK